MYAVQANVTHLTKADFLAKVYNYEKNPKEWKYEGDKPAIVIFALLWHFCRQKRQWGSIMTAAVLGFSLVYGKLYSYLFGWEPRGVVLHQVKYPSVQEVIATAKAAGAVLVFAHPTVYKSMPVVRQLAKEGIIDGIEVEHPRNSPEDRAECAALCEQYGLIHTGGTDFHGANHKVPHTVGTCTTADDQVARILELAHKRRGIDV